MASRKQRGQNLPEGAEVYNAVKTYADARPTPAGDPRSLNILQRLNSVQLEVDYIQKEKKAGMRYSIVSHDAVTAKVRGPLVRAGVIYYPVRMEHQINGNRTEIVGAVRFANVDAPDDFIDVATAGYGIDESDKGAGKAISYAVKYALLKALGLETGDDPDFDQDSRHEPRQVVAPRMASIPAGQVDSSKAVSEFLFAGAKMMKTKQEVNEFYIANKVQFDALMMEDPLSYNKLMHELGAYRSELK